MTNLYTIQREDNNAKIQSEHPPKLPVATLLQGSTQSHPVSSATRKMSWCKSCRRGFPKQLQNLSTNLTTSYIWHLLNSHLAEQQLQYMSSVKSNYSKANNGPSWIQLPQGTVSLLDFAGLNIQYNSSRC